jgi:nucleoside-diphosphate-sugar epimerase
VVSGHDVVFHLASAHLEVNEGPSYFEDINVRALARLVEICKVAGVGRLVHCSSVGVYGPLGELPANEESECEPEIPYEISKLAGEKIVRELSGDLEYVIIRPTWVYGPRCNRTLKLFQAIHRKKFIKVGSKPTYRHPIYISDMLLGFEQAAHSQNAVGQTLIVGSNEAVLLDELIAGITSALRSDFKPVTVPLFIMQPVCYAVEMLFGVLGKEPPFSTRSLKFFTESSAFDISRAKQVMGFEPQVEIDEGLKLTAEYFAGEGLL